MIQTSDFDQRGLEAPLVLAVLEADVSPLNSEDDDLTADPATVVMGELVVADATAPNGRLVIAQVERHNDGAAIRLRRTADDAHFSVYFDNEGSPVYPTAKLFVQIAAEGPRIAYSIGRTGGGYNNWTLDEAAQAAAVDGIGTGDRFLLAIAVPAVQTTGTATGRHASRGSTAGTAGALPQITTAAAGRHATRGRPPEPLECCLRPPRPSPGATPPADWPPGLPPRRRPRWPSTRQRRGWTGAPCCNSP